MSTDTVTEKGICRGLARCRIPLVVAGSLIVVAFAGYVFYDFNGDSFDVSDRQVMLIVTDSMDGDVHGRKVDSFPADTLVMIHKLSDDDKKQIQVGDVISFMADGKYNHHRVIMTNHESGYVITQGDNTPGADPPVYYKDINGEVIGTNHWMGSVFAFVKEYYVLLFLGATFVLISAGLLKWALKPEPLKE